MAVVRSVFAAALVVACSSPAPGAGKCRYEPFDGPCEADAKRVLRDGADGGPIVVEVSYRGDFRARARRSFEFPPAQEGAVLADVMTTPATCRGTTITTGNCSPGQLQVVLEGEDPDAIQETMPGSARLVRYSRAARLQGARPSVRVSRR